MKKKKSPQLRMPYFFGQQTPTLDLSGNIPELIKPESGWQHADSGMEDTLRWADDAGNMLYPEVARKLSSKSQHQRNEKVAGTNKSPSDGR